MVIQFVAASLALRLCWITGKITAWLLIALAISFMALRRCFTLYEWISRSTPLQPLDITTEMVGLAISALMLAGVALIGPLLLVIKQSEKRVKQSEEKYRFLVTNIPAVVFMGYRDGTVDFFDNKVTEVTGYPKEAFDSRVLKWPDIVVEEDVEEAKSAIIQALKAERAYVREYRIRHKDGKVLWIQERSQIVCDEQGKINYINGVFYDITLRKQAEETLRHQVVRDPLTNLFNRRYLDETLNRELSRVRRKHAPLGVIMLDLDHFKRFNDTFGHEAGDNLLQALGKFLLTHLRREDVACRYGGEEFVLIIPEASLEVVLDRSEEIREKVPQLQVLYRGQELESTTVSLGVAMFPEHGDTAEEVLRAADDAMYQAKAAGRNRLVVADGHR
jgi:diguanylate cyclase (GGDEF)-like protein/PAS domain S-box-containing protein